MTAVKTLDFADQQQNSSMPQVQTQVHY